MKELRGDATRVAFMNSGLVLFLYDDANADAIRSAGPTILEGFGDDDIKDPTLAHLAAAGLLVVAELEQDDDVRMQVALREPLTGEERGTDWLPPGQALIELPSGTLKIEGYDNLRLAADTFDDAEPGGTVNVPPGRYILSFYWRPLDADAPENGALPRHIVVLTPAGETGSVSNTASVLSPAAQT